LQEVLQKLAKGSELRRFSQPLKNTGWCGTLCAIMLGADALGMVNLGCPRHGSGTDTSTFLFVSRSTLPLPWCSAPPCSSLEENYFRPIVALSLAAATGGWHLTTKVNIKSSGEIQLLVRHLQPDGDNLSRTTVSKKYVDNIINSMMDTLVVISPES